MYIGLTGPNAAGKGEVAAYLKSKGFAYFSLSDILREELLAQGKEPTRQNLIVHGNQLRKQFGPGVLAERIKAHLNGKAVIDSIRNPEEIEELRQLPGFILWGIDAPIELRFKRAKLRKRAGDGSTLAKFKALEKKELSADPAAQQLKICMELVDQVIVNDATVEKLKAKVELALNKRPSWNEYFMKIALLVAERSTCRRHHVGALIVRDKQILTTGYNGAAAGTKDCLELGCLRDEKNIPSGERHEICRAIHAEQNAIIQAGLHGVSIENGTIYCTHSPCILCAKMIVNARIKKFVTCGKYQDEAFKPLFKEAGVEFIMIPRPNPVISILE